MSFICSYLEHLHLVCCATHFERPLSRILRFGSDEHYVMVSIPLAHCLLRNAFGATPLEDGAFLLLLRMRWSCREEVPGDSRGARLEGPLSRIPWYRRGAGELLWRGALGSCISRSAFGATPLEDVPAQARPQRPISRIFAPRRVRSEPSRGSSRLGGATLLEDLRA